MCHREVSSRRKRDSLLMEGQLTPMGLLFNLGHLFANSSKRIVAFELCCRAHWRHAAIAIRTSTRFQREPYRY